MPSKRNPKNKTATQNKPVFGLPSPVSAQTKHLYFKLSAILLPFILVAVIEIGLRLIGFGNTYPLFIDAPTATGYRHCGPDVIKRFINSDSPAKDFEVNTVYFQKEKTPETYRIIVQGASTAAGYPYGHFASPAAMLGQRLQRTFPEKNIEVITTALAGVSSYVLLDFADEIINEQPDAILIYAGHNEFLGILGTGSALSVSSSAWVTKLYLDIKDWRTFQLLQRIIRLFRHAPVANVGADRNLMAEIAREKEIPFGGELYLKGVSQFEQNLRKLLKKYQNAGIPVLIGTLASNERDQPPFVSKVARTTDFNLWQSHYQAGLTAYKRGEYENAVIEFQKSVAIDSCAADAYYALAHTYETLGDYDLARQFYLAAKDRDQLRFRAPEVFNDIIRKTAAEQNAIIVDVQEEFRRASAEKHGLIGNNLLLEHVHPNASGYFLLADAFYDALKNHNMISEWEEAIPEEIAWQEIPLTPVDVLYGETRIKKLKSDYPFQKARKNPNIPQPQTFIESLAYKRFNNELSWQESMHRLLDYYRSEQNFTNARRVAAILADAVPVSIQYQQVAGQLFLQDGYLNEGIRYLNRALKLQPGNTDVLLDIARGYFKMQELSKTKETLEKVLALNPTNETAKKMLASL